MGDRNQYNARLTPPVLPANVLFRGRLIDRLAEAREQNLINWLFGPPGAGKTTLASSFVDHLGNPPSLWLQLDAADSEVAAFFDYLGLAAEYVAPGIQRKLPRLTPDFMHVLPKYARLFGERLFAHLPRECVLVFDNVHDLIEDSQVLSVLPKLAMSAAKEQHFIFASRKSPPKGFARLLANQQLQLTEWSELRFTKEEALDLLSGIGSIGLEDAERIQRESEGWAAGMILISAPAQRSSVSELPGSDYSLVFDYLLDEALQSVAVRDVRLLEAASLFSSFSIDMAADIGARSEFDVDSLLTDLHRRRFFVEVHGGENPQYRFHPLFRRSLLDACRRRGSAEAFRQLQMNAARIALAAGQIDESAQLMIESKDHKTLSTMCIEHGARLLQAGRHQDLARWIRHIPSPARARDPWLSFWYASAQLPTAPLEATTSFAHIYEAFKANNDVVGRYVAWASAVDVMTYAWDDFSSAPYWLEELESLTQASPIPSPELECRIVIALMPLLIWVEGGIGRFPEIADRCNRLLHRADDPSTQCGLAASLMNFHHAVSGDLRSARNLAEEFHAEITHSTAAPSAKLFWYVNYGSYCMCAGDFDRGLELMTEASRIAKEYQVDVLKSVIKAVSVFIHLTCHNTDKLANAIDEYKSTMNRGRRVEVLLYWHLIALKHIQEKDPAAALIVLEEAYHRSQEPALSR